MIPLRCIVAGSRGIAEGWCVAELERLFRYEGNGFVPTEIVCGGARGPDTAGEIWAMKNKIPVTYFIPDWEGLGRMAGPVRNAQMAAYVGPTGALVAFWDGTSRGTANMIDAAYAHGLYVVVKEKP